MMQPTPQSASPFRLFASAKKKLSRRDDLTYQLMTIAAMLIVLVSVWVF